MSVAFWRWKIILALSITVASGGIAPKADPGQWQKKGYDLFERCAFKQAAGTFQQGVMRYPESAVLHYWLGKSYVRLAELSTFGAARNARKARGSLEKAVLLDPSNEDYVRELFDLYVDFPEFFDHGLDRAADLIGSVGSEESRQEMLMRLDVSRHEHVSLEGRVRAVTVWTVSGFGYAAPLP